MKRVAIVFLLLAACSSSRTDDRSTFAVVPGITFKHPQAWRAQQFSAPHLVTFLSQQTLHDPCVNNSCARPLDELSPNSVLIAIYDGPKGRVAKTNLRVGGQPAHKTVWHNGCTDLHADESFTVRFDNPAHTTTYTINACLRGPELPRLRADFDAVLRSVKFLD